MGQTRLQNKSMLDVYFNNAYVVLNKHLFRKCQASLVSHTAPMLQIPTLSSLAVTGYSSLRPGPEHDRGCIITPRLPVRVRLNLADPAANAFYRRPSEARSRTTRGRAASVSSLENGTTRPAARAAAHAAVGRSGRAAAARSPARPAAEGAGLSRHPRPARAEGLCPRPSATRLSPLLAGATLPERCSLPHAFPVLLKG